MDSRLSLRRLASLVKPHRRTAAVVFLGLLVEMTFNAAVPYSFKFIVDGAILDRDAQLLTAILVGLGIGVVVVSAVGLGRDYLYARMVAELLADLRQAMFAHMQKLSLGYYSRVQVGDLTARFSGDLATVEAAFTAAIPWGLLPALDVLAATILLFTLDWRLAMLAMLIWPLSLLGPRLFVRQATRTSLKRKQDEGQVLSQVQENIGGQPVVKALNLEAQALQSFQVRNRLLAAATLRLAFLTSLVERSAGIGILMLQVLVLGTGGWMAFQGYLTVGELAAFQALFLSMSYALLYVTQYAPTLLQAVGGMARVQELLSEPPRIEDRAGARPMPKLGRGIEFRNVSFGYDGGPRILDNLNVTVQAGTHVAFVGTSGSGKSTGLSLLMRFHEPSAGAVLVDGVDIRDYSQASLRAQIGAVFQDNFMFNVSVRENIRMGRLDATDADVETAASWAEVHDVVGRLPKGYDTSAGERGSNFSGGQRQRLAIARALLRDPPILVLDEATSALDAATEQAVNSTLARVGQGRTTISVTHRLASARHADRIFVFDAGRVIEQGTHDELASANGRYRELWDKQSGFSLSAEGDAAQITVGRLAKLPVFNQLQPRLLDEIAPLFVTEQHPAGRTVIHQGDPGDRFYLIVRGSVEVLRDDGAGAVRSIATLQDGDYFGELALLRNQPRMASVRTLVPSVLLTLQREQFRHLLERAPEVRARLEASYAERAETPDLRSETIP